MRVLAAFAKGVGSIHSTHITVHRQASVTQVLGNLTPSSDLGSDQAPTAHRRTHWQNNHMHKINLKGGGGVLLIHAAKTDVKGHLNYTRPPERASPQRKLAVVTQG